MTECTQNLLKGAKEGFLEMAMLGGDLKNEQSQSFKVGSRAPGRARVTLRAQIYSCMLDKWVDRWTERLHINYTACLVMWLWDPHV